MKHPIAIAAPILAVILAACGAPATTPATTSSAPHSSGTSALAASPPPSTSATVRTVNGRPMEPCILSRTTALCGTLAVPEGRHSPSGREIQLRVMVVPARAAQPAPDPVFFLAGGPGGAATASFAWATSTFSSLNATRDFVMVDQRGSLTVLVPGMGRTVGHLGCLPSIVVAFLEAGSVDGLDVSCAATGVPLPPFRTAN